MIEIPDKVTTIGGDAFAYCNNLNTVIIGKGVKTMSQGVFYDSNVKDVYVKALAPPSVSGYLLNSEPTIHVYASALKRYQSSAWAEFGTIVGDLDEWEATTGIEVPRAETKSNMENAPIYNLQGMQVTDLLPRTIYIQNGRKFMR